MMLRARLLLSTLLLAACGHRALPSAFESPYATPTLSRETRVVLVAGGDDVANFAAEVVAQRRIWRSAGIASSQIACYWAKPTPRAYAKDRRQYRRVADAMRACGPASPARVLADIAALAQDPPPYLYLYVTGHGVPSLGAPRTAWVLPPEERALLGSAALALDADPLVRVQRPDALLRARRAGVPDRELVVSPSTLREALARLPDATHKIVVLQGCFSGAFVAGAGTLADLPNTTVLTAAAADRPSFGCGSGTRMTFWGGALEHELRDVVGRDDTPERLPWARIHRAVAERVTRLERALGQKPSRPQLSDTANR